MKKQDNESLIQELRKRLDWYLMEASDEEFDADEVQNLMNLLDSLKADRDDGINEEFPVEEALSDFWKYCEEREEDERLLAAAGEEESTEETFENAAGPEEKAKDHKVLTFFRRHKAGVVAAAAVLIVVLLGGSWQVVANAEKHGGFFWWMEKNEEGKTMITSPENQEKPVGNMTSEDYYTVEEIPEEYREYIEVPLGLSSIQAYELDAIRIVQRDALKSLYIFLKDDDNKIHFEIKMYPQKILWIRDGYPEYSFAEEFEDNGIKYEVFKKEEVDGRQNYIIYFNYGNIKYATVGMENEKLIKEIAMEYGEAITESKSDKR